MTIKTPMIPAALMLLGLLGLGQLASAEAQDTAKDAPLLIIDGAGKEQKIKAWKIAAGTRHLTWLAPAVPDKPAVDPKEKPVPPPKGAFKPRLAIGPEALEFREEQSTHFVDGVVTLVPLDRIRTIEYDETKQTVTVKVATSDKAENDETLTGTTKYRGINKLTIEAEVDKGELGIAEVKFLGGVPKGIRSLKFPNPRGAAAVPTGRLATITLADKEKNVQKVADLQVLYRLPDGRERLLPTLMFKKTLKLDLAQIQKIHLTEGAKGEDAEWVVTLQDGEENTLSLLKTIPLGEQQATLEGLLGRVPAGYKLYPPHTFSAIQWDEVKKD